jgi:hypothetical protein
MYSLLILPKRTTISTSVSSLAYCSLTSAQLFAGKATLPKLSLWSDTGTFADQITKAQGRDQYTAQWYGLQTVFSRIDRLDYQVTGAGNPISMDLVTRYTLRGVPVPKTIESKILIWYDEATGKIKEVQDQWGGDALPEGEFGKAMRNLNSVTVPKMVGVPKTEEEDRQRRKYWPENLGERVEDK